MSAAATARQTVTPPSIFARPAIPSPKATIRRKGGDGAMSMKLVWTLAAAQRRITDQSHGTIKFAAWGKTAVHRLQRQQYRNPRQSEASLLWGKSARRTGLCRQSGRVVIRRWRRRQFSHQGASAQPALRGGSAMAQAGARQSSADSGADAAQCGQAALSGFREGLYAQRIFHEPEGDRALLQHARRPAALPVPW